jgi:DNA polymerase-4
MSARESAIVEPKRRIIHIDMDAFYASVEQRDFPELRGKAVAVGGSRERGVVAAASYEARKFGVYSAMSSRKAYLNCPHIIFVRPRFEVYKEVSRQIRRIFFEYTDLVEPLSLDEAYLDVTSNKKQLASARQTAQLIKEQIRTETGLTASAGVSFNKFLAKTATDIQKPDGLTVITPRQAQSFIAQLPITKFYGVGKVTAAKMQSLGIHTGQDLMKWEKQELIKHFGKVGHFYYQISHAQDDREVNPNRIRKSIGAENTFETDLHDLDTIKEELQKIALEVANRINKYASYGKTLTLKVKFSDFRQITRSKTVLLPLTDYKQLMNIAYELFDEVQWVKPVRLLGLTVSGLNNSVILASSQLTFPF